jgi:hypothetical protein
LGAFWLGVAQGFGLFYRHEAAMGGGVMGRSLLLGVVFGSGALAGLVGPGLLTAGERLMPLTPFVPAALAAAFVQVGVLALAMVWGPHETAASPAQEMRAFHVREGLAPTMIAAAAWFGMTALMLASPSAMISCGLSAAGVTGLLAWHVVAMYAPGFFMGVLTQILGEAGTALLGLALVIAALLLLVHATDAAGFALGLMVLAVGWCLATAATTVWLQRAAPPRWALAAHDACLLLSALAGAWVAPALA